MRRKALIRLWLVAVFCTLQADHLHLPPPHALPHWLAISTRAFADHWLASARWVAHLLPADDAQLDEA